MQWSKSIRWINALMVSGAMVGCHTPKEVHYLGEANLQHYRNNALEIDYPNVDQETPAGVVHTERPRTVKDEAEIAAWDMPLSEAIHIALSNNKIIRTRTGAGQLIANPSQSPSVYDPTLRATGFLFGNRGVEAALSDFDAAFSTSMLWGRQENVTNSVAAPGFVNTSETAGFTSQIGKAMATGGNFAVSHNWNYLGSNTPGLLFPSTYTGNLQAAYTQPLWAGSGVEYTRIAGPSRQGLGGLLGVNQGVLIARINEDISVADFESAVVTMLRDVEDLYWDLFLAYRQYEAENVNRDAVLASWTRIAGLNEAGAIGGAKKDEAQARESYFETRQRVELALNNIYVTENQFRRLLGLPVNDGRVIRPADMPLEAEYHVNWEMSLAEALTKRVELRRQKWQIKSLELQRIAAENACNPQLNFVSSYGVNGFGDKLIAPTTSDGVTAEGYNSAYGTLGRGDQTSWTLGLQFAMPIGLRAARAQLENTELQLIKARTGLAAQELDISHELAEAIQRLDLAYATARTNFDRRIASEARVDATEAENKAGIAGATIDLVVRAQASRAAAEIAYFTSLVDYNKAMIDLNQRRGTVLEVNNVTLAESEWTPAAQQEALRRAWARSYAKPNDKLDTLPPEFSSPVPYPKNDLFPGVPVNGPIPSVPPPSPTAITEEKDEPAGIAVP